MGLGERCCLEVAGGWSSGNDAASRWGWMGLEERGGGLEAQRCLKAGQEALGNDGASRGWGLGVRWCLEVGGRGIGARQCLEMDGGKGTRGTMVPRSEGEKGHRGTMVPRGGGKGPRGMSVPREGRGLGARQYLEVGGKRSHRITVP
ncbi:hypothetical protein KY285_033124 [Solanum tuberosum]|nr:hypothetical protein KY285_033124 [Solanum tuberosum]